MIIRERVELYKQTFGENCKAIEPVKSFIKGICQWRSCDDMEQLEALRKLNTELANAYQVVIPVMTVWVRDYNYVAATNEMYLTEPSLEEFLHLFRHHLQNIDRRYERRGLLVEDIEDQSIRELPYKDTIHKMYGEDDARAWAKYVIEMAQGID